MSTVASAEVKDKLPFDDYPGFYLQDNRQYRGLNPITKGTLEAKCAALLPEWLVKNKSVLDLGSCLGAAGQWALYYGAASYTGVEIQGGYVDQSRLLLSHWGERARIVQTGIREFLERCADREFDIVVAAGVIYHFIDPKYIVDQLCRVAKDVVNIESNHPRAVCRGELQPTACVTEYQFDQDANLADKKASLSGLSACSTVSALDVFFGLNAFEKNESTLSFPVNPDTTLYTMPVSLNVNIPKRYAIRYSRTHQPRAVETLEDCLRDGHGKEKNWDSDPLHESMSRKNQADRVLVAQNERRWEFNAEVAASFEHIARTSVPRYREVLDKTVEIIKKRGYENPKIIDVGSAIGTTLALLHDNGFRNLYGVDSSQDMLDRSFDQATLINSDWFPVEHGPFDVVIANWVLHFINQRGRYLQSIRDSLSPNGILILTEKVATHEMTHELYHDFKRKQGLSEFEIAKKRRMLEGVLVPYPLSWYLETLTALGFRHVDIVDAHYAFVTLVAYPD